MSELCLDDFYIYIYFFEKITGSEFATPFTNTILDVIPPHSVILQQKPVFMWVCSLWQSRSC